MKSVIVLGTTLLLTLSAQAGLYRWVDDAGNVHFSDKMPAFTSTKSHAELSKTGDVTKMVNPKSKQKELDSLVLAKKEKEERDEIKRIKREAQDMLQKRDDGLLSTYENKDELIRYFENKIRMIEGNTRILQVQNDVLNKKVVKLEKKISTTKHKKTQKSIADKIVNINKVISQYKQALVENDKHITTLSENYKSDLERYIELSH